MEKKKIEIPTGCFESDCESCKFGYYDAGCLCCGMYRRRIMPGEMDNKKCPHYKMRLIDKIKAGIGIYLLLAALAFVVEMMSCVFV